MDTIKAIDENAINNLSGETGFNTKVLLKDYYITAILYLIKDIEGIYFKGGTALQKIFLNYSRLSEDVDFTLTKDIGEIKKEITNILKNSKLFETLENSDCAHSSLQRGVSNRNFRRAQKHAPHFSAGSVFDKITKDKDVEGFTRLIIHYKGFSNEEGVVFIDLNKRAKLSMKPEKHEIKHFYQESIPRFSFNTVAKEEMIAGKMAAAIGRNQPRDHYDLYKIIKAEIPINLAIVKKKCEQSNYEFNIIKMFNRAKKLKKRWDDDLMPLLAEEADFVDVMTTLAKHFKLKEEKGKLKK